VPVDVEAEPSAASHEFRFSEQTAQALHMTATPIGAADAHPVPARHLQVTP
jgi:hypothetical protein